MAFSPVFGGLPYLKPKERFLKFTSVSATCASVISVMYFKLK